MIILKQCVTADIIRTAIKLESLSAVYVGVNHANDE